MRHCTVSFSRYALEVIAAPCMRPMATIIPVAGSHLLRSVPVAALAPNPEGARGAVFERAGALELRLAAGADDLRRAQRLRFEVFYGEGRAIADPAMASQRRDLCRFDEGCDHLIVIDTLASDGRGSKLVGTYRLLRGDVAEQRDGFTAQGEFDLAPLVARHPTTRFLELGRSCVHADYRSKRVIELLWRGLWLYAKHHRIDVLIGCASLPGTDLEALRPALSLLLTQAQADPQWQVAARHQRAAAFDALVPSAAALRRGLGEIPPLIKAYLRAGAKFGADVVVDHQFGTTDMFAVMPMADIERRYLAYYGESSCLSGVPVA